MPFSRVGSGPGAPSKGEVRAVTADLARTVVAELAPDELPAFALLSAPYLSGVDTSASDGGLEFGAVEAVATITPAVTVVCAAVAHAMLRGVEGAAERAGGAATDGLWRWLRRRRGKAAEANRPDWTPEQLARVREVALARARTLGLDEEFANVLADSVVGALVLDPERPR